MLVFPGRERALAGRARALEGRMVEGGDGTILVFAEVGLLGAVADLE